MEKRRKINLIVLGAVCAMVAVTLILTLGRPAKPDQPVPEPPKEPKFDPKVILIPNDPQTNTNELPVQTDSDGFKVPTVITEAWRFLFINNVIPLAIYGAIFVGVLVAVFQSYMAQQDISIVDSTTDTEPKVQHAQQEQEVLEGEAARHLKVLSWWLFGASLFTMAMCAAVNFMWHHSEPFSASSLDHILKSLLIWTDRLSKAMLVVLLALLLASVWLYLVVSLHFVPALFLTGLVLFLAGVVALLTGLGLISRHLTPSIDTAGDLGGASEAALGKDVDIEDGQQVEPLAKDTAVIEDIPPKAQEPTTDEPLQIV